MSLSWIYCRKFCWTEDFDIFYYTFGIKGSKELFYLYPNTKNYNLFPTTWWTTYIHLCICSLHLTLSSIVLKICSDLLKQVSQWHEVPKYVDFTARDAAIRLSLISKVRGLEQVEKYFDSLPNDYKAIQVYCALAMCYAIYRRENWIKQRPFWRREN